MTPSTPRSASAITSPWRISGRVRSRCAATIPAGPASCGRDEVLDSWYSILVMGDTPDIDITQPTIIRHGTTAMVFCTEHLGEVSLIATNTFIVEDGCWRMVHHQAAHLPS